MTAVDDPSSGDLDARAIVAAGYEAAADAHASWAAEIVDTARPRYLEAFSERLPAGARVLELGCGGGGPTMLRLAERFDLTGIDIAERQVTLARERMPGATFIHADMTRYEAEPEAFDGVAAFYPLIHLPLGELPGMLSRIAAWLRPGGLIVASFGARGAGEHLEADWLAGAPMYWSSYSTGETLRFVEDAGLEVVMQAIEENVEDGKAAPLFWVLAQRSLLSGWWEGSDDRG